MTTRHLGVAVGLPDAVAADLHSWRAELGDPSASRIVPHVTLLPPSELPEPELPAVHDHLEKVAAGEGAFDIRLRGTATFRPVSPVVFLALVEGISEMERLEMAIRSGPLHRDLRFPYHPHVTIAQDVGAAALDRGFEALADYDVTFRADGFALFERSGEGVWRVEREFPFGLSAPPPAPAASGSW